MGGLQKPLLERTGLVIRFKRQSMRSKPRFRKSQIRKSGNVAGYFRQHYFLLRACPALDAHDASRRLANGRSEFLLHRGQLLEIAEG